MTYIVPNGYSRCQIDFAPAGARGSSPTFGFGVSAPPSAALMDVIQLWLENSFVGRLGNNYTIVGIRLYDDTTSFLRPVTLPGEYTGAQAPPNVSVLVSLSTALRGRENRGRMYIPGWLSDADLFDDGTISSPTRATLQGNIDDLQDNIADGVEGAGLVILHTTSSDPTPINGAVVQGVVATQRRRLRK